jgi:ferrous iron transport protein B
MMDELEKLGKQINVTRLEEELNIPVVPTVSTSGRGMDILRGKIEQYVATNDQEDQV